MADPLTDKINAMYHSIEVFYDERYPPEGGSEDRWIRKTEGGEAARVHRSKEGALGVAGQMARSAGAPEDARVILDYLVDVMVDRVLIDWHTPEAVGQPGLIRRGFESFRLSEIPR